MEDKRRVSRRDFLRLSAVAATGTLVAACVPPTPQPVAVGKPAPAEKAVKLTVVITGEGEDLRENIKPFLEKHPEIQVEVIGVAWAGFDEKVDLLIAGGDPPAIWYPAGKRTYTYYAEKDLLAEITPFVDRDNYDLTDFYPSALQPLYWHGKLLGFPAANFITFLVHNKTLFDQAGVPIPPSSWEDKSWTWNEFIERAKAVTKPAEDPMQTIWGFGGGFDYRYALLHFGADYWEEEAYHTGKPTKSLVTTKPAMEAYQLMQDLIWKHQVQPSPEMMAAFGAATKTTMFLSGKAAMDTGATWAVASTLAGITDFEWGMGAWPANEWNGPRTILYAGNWLMFKHPHQDAAWELLKFFVSPEAIRKQLELERAGRRGGITQGGLPGRLSMGKEWADVIAEASKRTPEEIEQVIVKGMEYSHIFPSQATGKWGEIHDVAVRPELDKVLLNKTTVPEAVVKMEEKINEILQAP